MRKFATVFALLGLVFAGSAKAENFDLKKINDTIGKFLSPLLTEYPLVKDMKFNIQNASVSNSLVSGAAQFSVSTNKSKWSTTPTTFILSGGGSIKLIKAADENQDGVSESMLKFSAGLKTDTLALYRHLGASLFSPEECGENGSGDVDSCRWYKMLSQAKALGDIKAVFVDFKATMLNDLAKSIAEIEQKLKTLPPDSEEYQMALAELENAKSFEKILKAITIVEKNSTLTVTVKDVFFDAAKKSGLKKLDVVVGSNETSISADILVTDTGLTFDSARANVRGYLKALQESDEDTLKDVKEMAESYIKLALEIIVGQE